MMQAGGLFGFDAMSQNDNEAMESQAEKMSEGDGKSGMINREKPDAPRSREALVKKWIECVKNAKEHWKADFKAMRDSMDFVRGNQWGNEGESKDKYVANIIQRHIQQRVASLYAKNPKAICKRRRTMDFSIWDESSASLQTAYTQIQSVSSGMAPPTPAFDSAQFMVQDAMQGFQKRAMMDKVAKTLEILFHYYIHNQEPNFKLQMKQLVRRVCTTSIGFVKLGFQRIMEKRPEDVDKITDVTQRISTMERIMADKLDDKIEETSMELERLRLILSDLQKSPQIIVKEGIVFDFPQSTSIIVDPRCRNIRTFVGAQWVAQEFILDANDIKEIYKIDVGKNFSAYKEDAPFQNPYDRSPKGEARDKCVVWEIYSKADGMQYVVCDGYGDFLQEPCEPPLLLERFWPFFTLTFNDIENEKKIYPPSDVELLMPMQKEYNRSRQALREHRIANRPCYAVPQGMLDEEDVMKLQTRPNNAVIALNALQQGQKVDDVIQPVKSVAIDPSLYDVNTIFDDILKTVGAQEANFGGTNSATATQSSIAESSRSAAIASNVDDLDDFLTDLSRSAGQVLLMNLNEETVKSIVGPGAVWPTLSAQNVADELMLEIEAGSSGRPNKAAETANFQQIAPILMQIPGINTEWLAKEAVKRMDDGVDLTDAIAAGAQSIIAMNAQKQMTVTADAQNAPAAQGQKGEQNAQSQPGTPPPPPGPPQTVGGPLAPMPSGM
jgi:hypothetical protein